MTLEQARKVLDDTKSDFSDLTEAAAVVARSQTSTLEDLLTALKPGGLPAELSAIELYRRTGRVRANASPESLITDLDDWQSYLHSSKANGMSIGKVK